MLRKWWFWLIAVVVVIGIFFGVRTYLNASAQAATYQTSPAQLGTLIASVGATGTVEARQSAVLSFAITGRVGEVSVSVGQKVTTGQAIVTMDPAYYPQQVITAQANLINAQKSLDNLLNSNAPLAQAEQNLANAKKAMDNAKTSFDNALRNYNSGWLKQAQDQVAQAYARWQMLRRNDGSRAALILLQQAYQEYLRALQNLDKAQHYFDLGLIGSGGGTPKQKEALDIAKGNYDVAVAQYNDALRAYNRLVNGVPADDLAAAQAQVDAAQSVLDQTRLVAPFNGTILEVDILPGDMVNPGTVAVVVADLSELHVDVPIAEVDFNSIAVGQPAQLTLDAVPNATYIGSVTQISLHATVSGGSVSYPIRVVFTNPDGLVVPGMTVAVNIEVKHLENVLLVPNRAVRSSGGSLFIYVLRNGSLVSVAVQLGESNGTESQVTGGDLNVGDQIVLNPPTSLLGSFGPGSSNSGGGGGFGSLRSMGA